MKRILVTLGVAATLAFVGCDSKTTKGGAGSGAPKSSATVKTVDVPSAAVKEAEDACDAYVKALEACIDKQEGDAKEPFKKELAAHNQAFKEAGAAAKTQMENGCMIGASAVKQACE